MKLEVTANNALQVLPPNQHAEIQSVLEQANSDWDSFVSSVSSIKTALQRILNLWLTYETEQESFISWLRDMESKVKSETTQQVEFNDIQQHLSVIMVCYFDIFLCKSVMLSAVLKPFYISILIHECFFIIYNQSKCLKFVIFKFLYYVLDLIS